MAMDFVPVCAHAHGSLQFMNSMTKTSLAKYRLWNALVKLCKRISCARFVFLELLLLGVAKDLDSVLELLPCDFVRGCCKMSHPSNCLPSDDSNALLGGQSCLYAHQLS